MLPPLFREIVLNQRVLSFMLDENIILFKTHETISRQRELERHAQKYCWGDPKNKGALA